MAVGYADKQGVPCLFTLVFLGTSATYHGYRGESYVDREEE
jgi:hypothetical protein